MHETELDAFDDGFFGGADPVAEDFFFSFGETGDVEGKQREEDHRKDRDLDSGGHEVGGLGFRLRRVLEQVKPGPTGNGVSLVNEDAHCEG